LNEDCLVSLIGEQDNETIGELYSRVQSVIDTFMEIATCEENIGEFFEFSENGVVDKREKNTSTLLESAIEETEEITRSGTINEQVHAIKNMEKTTIHQQDMQKLEKDN